MEPVYFILCPTFLLPPILLIVSIYNFVTKLHPFTRMEKSSDYLFYMYNVPSTAQTQPKIEIHRQFALQTTFRTPDDNVKKLQGVPSTFEWNKHVSIS